MARPMIDQRPIHYLLAVNSVEQSTHDENRIQKPGIAVFSDADHRDSHFHAINRFKKLVIQPGKLSKLDFAPALKACSKAFSLAPGKQIHALSFKCSLSADVHVQTSLLTMYSACGEMDSAVHLFDKMPERNVVSWTAMINAHLLHNQPKKALSLYHKMRVSSIELDSFAIISVLSTCSSLGMLNLGRWVHTYVQRGDFQLSPYIGTALIDMYCKCGRIDDALAVFNCMERKSVQTWNAMLHGLSANGKGPEAIELFKSMEADNNVYPNEATFIAVLCGCSHCGLFEEGRHCFYVMQNKYNIKPTVKHYGCMVDLLGRAGRLGEAFKLARDMQIPPNIIVWGSLLNACRMHNDIAMAESVMTKIDGMRGGYPRDDTSHLVIMSNMYLDAGLEEAAAKMRVKVGKKPRGSSWIEVNCGLKEFSVGKTSNPAMKGKIHEMLVEVAAKTGRRIGGEEEGVDAALQNAHSEMLAVAFGLLNVSVLSPIRITKNLRICNDCHEIMKSISEVYQREVIVRDCTRFHHFQGGRCSCCDYW